jgi:hypothetical protein
VQECEQTTRRDGKHQREPATDFAGDGCVHPAGFHRGKRVDVDAVGGHRTHQHHPLDADVDDGGTFAHQTAVRRQRDRRGIANRLIQHPHHALPIALPADDGIEHQIHQHCRKDSKRHIDQLAKTEPRAVAFR